MSLIDRLNKDDNLDGLLAKINSDKQVKNDYLFPSEDILIDYSKYEPYLGESTSLAVSEWDDERARQQSGWAKLANSTGQMAGTFGTALASTVATLGGGIVGAVGQLNDLRTGQDNTDFMDVMVNNPVMQGINEFDKYLKEDLLPTYYTKEQQESLFSASTGTDLLNGLGFLASNVIPNAAVTKLFGSFGKMANAAKAGKLVGVLDKAVDAGQITNAEKTILGGVGKYFEKAPAMIGAAVGRIGESSMEAYGTYEQIKESLTAESELAQQELEMYGETDKKIRTPEEIEAEAKRGRDNVFMGNMALAVSDMMQFTRWFKGDNIADRFIKDGFKTTVKELGKKELIGSLIKEASQEAAEEGFQFLLSKGAEKSAQGKSFIEGMSEASGELFSTIEGQKSMLLGAILGGGVGTALNIRNEKQLRPQLEQLANNLTLTGNATDRYIVTPEGKRIINPELSKTATNFMFYEQIKQKAIEAGDQEAYDLAEKMQFADLVSAKQDAGQLEDFIDELKEMAKSTPEEVEAMFGELPIRNGKKLTPQEIVFEKIQLAERVKELNDGLIKLPQLQNSSKASFNLIRHNLFTQEILRNKIEQEDLKIAAVKGKAVNEYNLETGEVEVGKLLPFDELELKQLEENKKILFDEFAKVSTKFKEYIAEPAKAEKIVEETKDNAVKEAIKEAEDTAKKTEETIKTAEEEITIFDKQGNQYTFIAENEDGSIVLEDINGNLFTQSKQDFQNNFGKEEQSLETEETNDVPVTPEDERLAENTDRFIDPDSAKKFTILSSTGQAIQLDGNEVVIEEGEAVLREEFKNQTETFNKPTISNNIVTSPSEKPNLIQFKAELGKIESLEETNKRREANDLEPLTQEDLESDEFIPIKLTVIINGRANNSITHFFHTPDYYYKTAEYDQIEKSDLSDEAKKQAHEVNLEKYKRIRSQLVKAIKDNKSVILNTVSKSTGVLNYNPKVGGVRKTSPVLEVFEAGTTQEFIAPKTHNLYIIENGKAQQIKTKGLQVVSKVEENEDGTYNITTTDSVLGTNTFISKFPYALGELLYDVVSPNGSVLRITPFNKKSFSSEQIDNIANLLLHRLTNGNIIEVNGKETPIIGTDSNPGIIDSLIYVGIVKSSSPEAINSQLVFSKDGTLILGTTKITKEDPEAYNKIKAHLLQYKSKPQFKMRSKDIESFGIPVQTEKGWKIEKPTSYLNFMFKGENALIQTALNKTKFVNTYFNFATDNNGDLIIEGKKTDSSKQPSQVKPDDTDIDAKKADIEKRRKEELDNALSDVNELRQADTVGKAQVAIVNATQESSLPKAVDTAGMIVGESVSVQASTDIVSVAKRLADAVEKIQKPAVDKINAKYDAELAALEGAKPAESKKEIVEYKGVDYEITYRKGKVEVVTRVNPSGGKNFLISDNELIKEIKEAYEAELAVLKKETGVKTDINSSVKEKENECKTGTPSDLTGFDIFD